MILKTDSSVRLLRLLFILFISFSISIISPSYTQPDDGCEFPPPEAVNLDVCEGESTVIDLASQVYTPLSNFYTLDFESAGGYSTSVAEFTDLLSASGEDFFIRTDGSDHNGGVVYNNPQGSYYFAGMDLDGEGASPPLTFDITGIDITGKNGLLFSILLAEDDNGINQDWDASDYVHIDYQIDGSGFQDLIHIEMDANETDGNNGEPLLDIDFDGGGDGTIITATFEEFTANILGSGTTLDIKITMNLNANGEDIAFDNIMIFSEDGPSTSFNFYDANPGGGMAKLLDEIVTLYDPMTTVGDSPQSIWVTATDGDCETDATEMTISVKEGPVVSAVTIETILCEGDDLELFEEGGDADSWSWTGPGGFTSELKDPVIMNAPASASGTYVVRGTNTMTGCTDSAEIEIIVKPNPSAPIVPQGFFCEEADIIITPSPGPFLTCELFISEYIEGTDNNKCIEIFNGTGATVDLSSYGLELYSNGSAVVSQSTVLSGILAEGEVYVICHGSASSEFLAQADNTNNSVINFNGDDAFVLTNNGIAIDVIGQIGFDPGTRWSNGGVETRDQTIIRTSLVSCGDGDGTDAFDPSLEWNSFPQNTATELGSHTYQGVNPDPTLYNFYDANPNPGPANLLDGPTDSYEPGEDGTYFVTSLVNDCESEAIEAAIVISQGFQPLNCNNHLNLTFGGECTIVVTAEMMLEGEGVMFEFVSVELTDQQGNIIPNATLDASHIGKVITASVIDDCNRNSCWGTITVEDKSAVKFDCPENIEVSCTDSTDPEFTGEPSILGLFCGSEVEITYRDHIELYDCEGEYQEVIHRTFIAIDDLGNNSDPCTQEISILRESLAAAVFPEHFDGVDTHIGINDNGVASNPPLPCDGEGVTWNGIARADGMLVPSPYDNGLLIGTGVPGIPTGSCNTIIAGYEDMVTKLCGYSCSASYGSYEVFRSWSVIDWCTADIAIHHQIIRVEDSQPPIVEAFAEEPYTISVDPWSCVVADLQLPDAEATDNCTPFDLTYYISGPAGIEIVDGVAKNVPVGEYEFIYNVSDCCGNLSDPQVLKVHVIDQILPIAIVKQEIVVSLSYDVKEDDGSAKLYAHSVDNGSYDDCSEVSIRVKRDRDVCRADSDEYGPFVKFCCRDVGKTFQVWLEVRDTSGNVNETWANVLVEEKYAVIECKDVYIECFDDVDSAISANNPDAYGTCRSKNVEEVSRDYTYYDETCNSGVIYVTWAVRDLSHIKCVQAIYVNYESSIVCDDIDWPDAFRETDCMDLEPYEVTWNADPCDLIGWTVTSDTFSFQSGACAKIINDYIVIDWCAFDSYMNEPGLPLGGYFEGGNDVYDGILCEDPDLSSIDSRSSPTGVYHYIEVIKLVDDIAPEILVCDFDPFVITSGCSRPITISNIGVDNSGCPLSILTWELTLTTDDGYVYNYAERSKPGEKVNFELVDEEGDPLFFDGPMSSHHIRIILSDGCGNVDKCETDIMVVDRKDPTPYCIHLSSAVMENGQVEIWARDFDLQSFDNCSGYDSLYFTYDGIFPEIDLLKKVHYFNEGGVVEEDVEERYASGEIQKWLPERRSSARIFTCEDLPSVTFGMSVWDEKFNTDYCEVTLNLVDNQDACEAQQLADISGNIVTKEGNGIADVDVLLENISNVTQLSFNSDRNGTYAIKSLPMFQDYEITPSKEGDIVDGLSTEDVLLIQKFIMDESVFSNPYDIIASDINNDKRISASDIILLQRIIIGQLTELKDGIWKFVDAAQELTIENALADYRNNFDVLSLTGDLTTDFIGVKMGDVTGDVSTNMRQGVSSRTHSASVVMINDKTIKKGEIVEVPIMVPDYESLVGYQMTIALDGAKIVDVTSASTDLYASNIGRISDQMLAVSYADIRNTPLTEHIFTLNILTDRSGKLSEIIEINNQFIESEAYRGIDVIPSGIVLEFIEDKSINGLFTVGQNSPNPFNQETTIQFVIPEHGTVTLAIYNVSGQLLHYKKGEFTRGSNMINVRNSDLNFNNGVLYYKMTYNDQSVTKKMVVIE